MATKGCFMRILNIFLLLIPFSSFANSGEQLVEQFFSPNGIDNKESVYIGEMLEHHLNDPTLGKNLSSDVSIKVRPLEKSTKREIYAVLLTKNDQSIDWYIYLKKDKDKWKLSAVRKLALPGFLYMAIESQKNNSNKTVEQEYKYQNMLLIVKSDAELKKVLLDNIEDFQKLVHLKSDSNEIAKLTQKLNLNSVNKHINIGVVDISIGGITDNSVGYFYVPTGSTVPRMSDDKYIYIEQIQDNWYLYKTT